MQIERNKLSSKVDATELVWGKQLEDYESYGSFDYILACDMAAPVYEAENFVKTVKRLFECNPNAKLLLASQTQRELTPHIYRKLSETFELQRVPQGQLHSAFLSPFHNLCWVHLATSD